VKRSDSPTAVPEAAVLDVYRELEARPVERNCIGRADCCRFRLTGQTPYVTKGEALAAARAVRARGRTKLTQPADGSCPLLGSDGRCMAYEARPFGCRTHFCAAAGGPVERKQVEDLIRRLAQLDSELGGDGVRALPGALTDALTQLDTEKAGKGSRRVPRR